MRNFYCASMMLLLKLWQDVKLDLRSDIQSWPDAYNVFLGVASQQTSNILDNIQFYYKAKALADLDQDVEEELQAMEEHGDFAEILNKEYTEKEVLEVVQHASICSTESSALAQFGASALEVACQRGIFVFDKPGVGASFPVSSWESTELLHLGE